MSALHWMTVEAAARAIAAKELSPVDLTKALLERIEQLDPRLNAFIRVDGDAAMAASTVIQCRALIASSPPSSAAKVRPRDRPDA